jgi:2-hydroxychromene-2-carboxylate isomerase
LAHVDFYFDFISPYAYFAWLQIRDICRKNDATLSVHPILFAAVLEHHGQLGPAEIPSKRNATFKDIARFAAQRRIPLEGPKTHPFNPLTALRACQVSVAGDRQFDAIDAIYMAGWGHGADLGDPEAILNALVEHGMDGMGMVEKTRDPDIKAELRSATQAAIRRGVFGVPTMVVGEELFWGNDRLHFVELALQGKDPLPDGIEAFLSRPAGAVRPGSKR